MTSTAADDDGRLTAIPSRGGAPAKSLSYDALGRLVSATVNGGTRSYGYDPLDRLVTISEDEAIVTRFRYVGLTGSVAQLADGEDTVLRNVGTDWTGASLADWAPGPTGWHRYLANGHGDLVATLAADGSVAASVRLDPWGVPLRAVPAGYPAFGLQGSLTDRTTTLVYARARWYDPVLATFTSEDPLPGDPADPPSRHLYAYGAGDPVDRADVSGLFWYRVKAGDSLESIAAKYWGRTSRSPTIYNANRSQLREPRAAAGQCIWVRKKLDSDARVIPNQCAGIYRITGSRTEYARQACDALRCDWYNVSRESLIRMTARQTGRVQNPGLLEWPVYSLNLLVGDIAGGAVAAAGGGYRRTGPAGMVYWFGNSLLPGNSPNPKHGRTLGSVVFWNDSRPLFELEAHEYIHVLQQQSGPSALVTRYLSGGIAAVTRGAGFDSPTNPMEAIPYLWQEWLGQFKQYGEKPPWCDFRPLKGSRPGC